jgi:two-component system, NarL family, nitrate/nitrite response regulator NarL
LIRILIADDHPIFREGLVHRLSLEPDIEVIAQAENGKQAVELITEIKKSIDVVLMDINMPELDGMYALEILKEQENPCKVIMLSMYDNKEYILTAMRHGAEGYILKDVPGTELLRAIRIVAEGKRYFSSEITEILSLEISNKTITTITRREQLVLRLISHGMSNKKIANELNVSIRTVETHKRNIKQKLGIDDTFGLMRYALDYGLDR